MSEAECCSPGPLDRTRLDFGVVGMLFVLPLLLLFCHGGTSSGCRCAGLLLAGDSAAGDPPADAVLNGGGGMSEVAAVAQTDQEE